MAVQFCRECNNLLYPRIENTILQYVCNRCETTTDPTSCTVTSTNLKVKHTANPSFKQYLTKDLTLPRFRIKCSKCSNQECVGYMDNSDEKALNSYYVCTACYFEWTD